jgi:hypothetical protein
MYVSSLLNKNKTTFYCRAVGLRVYHYPTPGIWRKGRNKTENSIARRQNRRIFVWSRKKTNRAQIQIQKSQTFNPNRTLIQTLWKAKIQISMKNLRIVLEVFSFRGASRWWNCRQRVVPSRRSFPGRSVGCRACRCRRGRYTPQSKLRRRFEWNG